jgi:DHA1 family tetracycline resistance protein-like MFS transporter
MSRKLLPYALVVLLGYIGFSLPLPVLPEMFLDAKRSILPITFSLQKKMLLLGVLMMAYPIGQLVGSPILGQYSDRWGRKRVICLSLLGNALGYVVTALAASLHSVSGLFAGLLICGFSEGNVAIAQAVIADISKGGKKVEQFGWINLFTCLAFIVGPLLGGYLADPEHNPHFTFATPFWFAAGLTLLALCLVFFFSEETKDLRHPPSSFLRTFWKTWKNRWLRRVFVANFFTYLGIYAFWRYFPVYLQTRFDFSSTGLAYAMAYQSFAYGVAILWLIKPLAKMYSPKKLTMIFSLLLGLSLIVIVVPSSPYSLIWSLPPVGILLSIVMTNIAVMASDAADPDKQGQAMGSLQAVQVVAEVITAIGGAVVAAALPSLPLIIGGLIIGVSVWLFASVDRS